MKKYVKVLVATGLSAGVLLGTVATSNAVDGTAQAAKEMKKPYYSYKGVFNHKSNDALKDKYFYQALKADNFKYEGLKVGESTKADMEKAWGKDVKSDGVEGGITYYTQNGVILGFDANDKLVDLALRVNEIKDNEKDIKAHVNSEGFYDAGMTQVSFFPGDVIVITAKDRVAQQ
ncbi:hypothetical protein [Staphylococcus sp. 17KM0847]|uniref:immunodominant staphylococcal antigen IsaB family protein n=1 Tax=Staphylococcus sp. 17KM0847 TaxID=2583989 RepID=UPI0015DC97DD|nr:hypothetical protein [Staphylococcus sp. 17KM0847]QLK86873.1 hypothetical protein FGL66_09285 [Staphylococcus sp. 17KM0847]